VLEAMAADVEDASLTIHWRSDVGGELGTGASLAAHGLAVGVHTIVASVTDSGNDTAEATITIVVNEHPAVAISSPVSSGPYAPGAAVGFLATAADPEDGSLTDAIAWTDEFDNGLGTGGAINVSSLTSGTHLITATVQDSHGVVATDHVTVIIDALPTLQITGPASGGKYVPGAEVALTATASDLEDGPLGSAVHWSSSLDGALGTGASLPVTTLSSGTHTITATVEDAQQQTASDLITVIVNAHPTLAITAPANDSMYVPGADVTLAATASDVEDASLTIHWTSSLDGGIGAGASLTVSSLSAGVHTITASVTDSGDEIAEATVTVVINAAPAIAISAPTSAGPYAPGAIIAFAATASDAEDGSLTDEIAWTAETDALLGAGGTLDISSLAPGSHTITATVQDARGVVATDQVVVIVDAAPTLAITGPASGQSFQPHAEVVLTATASDPEDGALDTTIQWSSSLDGALGTGATLPVTTLSSGTHTITATVEDSRHQSASDLVTVIVNATPTLVITAPAEGAAYAPGADVTLQADAIDVEDESLTVHWMSSLDGDLGTGATLTVSTLASGVHIITATVTDSGNESAEDTVTVVINSVPTVTIDAPTSAGPYAPGATITFSATASDAEDGSLTNDIAWTDELDTPLGTGGALDVSSLTAGSHTITATAQDARGVVATDQVVVIVDGPPTLAITGPASGQSFQPHDAIVLTATASDPEDGAFDSTIEWSSSLDGALGTGATLPVTTLSSGTHTITATVEDAQHQTASDVITVIVNAHPTVAITTPANDAMFTPGADVTLEATASDAEDASLTVHWTSSLDGGLGTGASLTLSSLSAGVHTITASVTDSGNEVAEATVTVVVNAAPTVAISAPASAGPYAPGATIGFAATAADSEDGSLTSAIAWTDETDASLGTGGVVDVSSLGAGSHTITATVQDSRGVVATDQVVVLVDAAPTLAITGPASGQTFQPGDEIVLTATASDPEDGAFDSTIQWSSSLDGPLGTGATLPVTTLSSGTHTITAAVEDAQHQTASDLITVIVDAHPTVAITTPADGTFIDHGTGVELAATATDEDGDLSGDLAWTSSLDGPLGTGASLTVMSLSPGTHEITASVSDHLSQEGHASITLKVNVAPVVTITEPADAGTVAQGTSVTFTATAEDDYDGDLAGGVAWVSDLDGALHTGASFSTDALTVGTHTITATATDGRNLSAADSITITVE
jgi:hypothetical protein